MIARHQKTFMFTFRYAFLFYFCDKREKKLENTKLFYELDEYFERVYLQKVFL